VEGGKHKVLVVYRNTGSKDRQRDNVDPFSMCFPNFSNVSFCLFAPGFLCKRVQVYYIGNPCSAFLSLDMFPRFAKNPMSPALGRSFRRFQSSVPLSKLRPSSFIAKAAAGGAIFGVVLSGLDHKPQSEARKKLQRTSDPASVSSPGWSLTNNEPVPRPDLPTFTLVFFSFSPCLSTMNEAAFLFMTAGGSGKTL